jgi:hypothetical protein
MQPSAPTRRRGRSAAPQVIRRPGHPNGVANPGRTRLSWQSQASRLIRSRVLIVWWTCSGLTGGATPTVLTRPRLVSRSHNRCRGFRASARLLRRTTGGICGCAAGSRRLLLGGPWPSPFSWMMCVTRTGRRYDRANRAAARQLHAAPATGRLQMRTPAAEHAYNQCPAEPLPDCHRCGRPAAEHRDGQCPRPAGLGSDLAWGAAKGLATTALVVAVGSGLAWVATTGSAQSCTFTGQLEGGTCYPFLE